MTSKRPRSIVEEIKQTRPFATKAQETAVALLRTTDMVKRRLSRVVEREGLTLQQYNVLRILRGARGTPLCAFHIADRLIEETPGVSRLLDRLVAKGLVHRERSTEDRRALECRITPMGEKLLARLDEPVAAADAAALEGLSAREIGTLNDLLSRVRATHAR